MLDDKNWNEVDRAILIHLYVDKGYTDQEICEHFNVSRSQVTYKKKKLGLSAAELKFKKFINSQDNDLINKLQDDMKKNVIEMGTENIAKALAHYLFRNGPIEDMHANGQLSQNDMMILNKYIYNRLNTIIHLLKENDWVRFALILDFHKYYGITWDEPELCVDEIDKIVSLIMNG